ncbi:MAG: hypothetical protein ACI4V5_03770 [Prevotella sp.]
MQELTPVIIINLVGESITKRAICAISLFQLLKIYVFKPVRKASCPMRSRTVPCGHKHPTNKVHHCRLIKKPTGCTVYSMQPVC